jgi:hypothetical protein
MRGHEKSSPKDKQLNYDSDAEIQVVYLVRPSSPSVSWSGVSAEEKFKDEPSAIAVSEGE